MRFELGHFKLSAWEEPAFKAKYRFQMERWIELPEALPYYREPVITPLSASNVTEKTELVKPVDYITYGRVQVTPWPWSEDQKRYVYATIDNIKEMVEWMKLNDTSRNL